MIAKTVLLIIAYEGYQITEYEMPKKVLEQAGVKVVTASNKPGVATTQGGQASVDLVVKDVKVTDYDGIFLIGGLGALDNLDNQDTYNIMQTAHKNNKLIGAICISPRILAHAGLLTGRKATGWNMDGKLPEVLATAFATAKATFVDQKVVVDGSLITASGPLAAQAFGEAIVNYLLH